MRDLLNVLPDDRPVTSICIVEDAYKPPAGYYAVLRTYDQDTDADLWKEGFFGRKITRYLCLSKTEGLQNYVVQSLTVVNDKETPPDGYTALTHTSDSMQKATKKRLLCFKNVSRDNATEAITDVIVLGKLKKAPAGFTLAGDMNGYSICFKMGMLNKSQEQSPRLPEKFTRQMSSQSAYSNRSSILPMVPPPPPTAEPANLPYPVMPLTQGTPPLYPVDQLQSVRNSRQGPVVPDYGMTWHAGFRPVSQPILPTHYPPLNRTQRQSGSSNIVAFGLEGVPFQLNSKLERLDTLKNFVVPRLDRKTETEIGNEYNYDFSIEHQTLQRIPQGQP